MIKQLFSVFMVTGIAFSFCLSIATPTHAAQDPLARTAIIGDSMTTGYGASSVDKGYAGLLDSTFNMQGRDVQTFAVNGATALRWLKCPQTPTMPGCDSAEYAGQYEKLKAYQPTAVLIALGGNEMIISRSANTYAQHMLDLARKVYSLVPAGTSIVFVHYYDISAYGAQLPAPRSICDFPNQCSNNWFRHTWSQYRNALSSIATPNGVSFIDIADMQLDRNTNFVSDRVHLNDSGHVIYYNKLNTFLQQVVPPPQPLSN